MAGFNLPIQAIPPQLLAEMARAAFRPPALMGVGGLGGGGGGGMQMPQSPGFNMGQGMAGMGQGLGMLAKELGKGPSLDERTRRSDAEIAEWSGYGTPAGRASLDQMMGGVNSGVTLSPLNPSYGDLGMPSYGGGAADGGPVMPGKYYTVGERGPETFVPAVPGYIVPNDGRYVDNYAPPSGGRYVDSYAPPSDGRYIDNYAPPSGGRYVDAPPERDFFGGRRRR